MRTSVDNYKSLTTVPASDDNFKVALEDALLETLDDALQFRGLTHSKTAYNAVLKEIKRRYSESDSDSSDLPSFEQFVAKRKEEDETILQARKAVEAGTAGPISTDIAKRRLSTELLEAYQLEVYGSDVDADKPSAPEPTSAALAPVDNIPLVIDDALEITSIPPVTFTQPVPAAPPVALHNQYHQNGMAATAQAACWLVLAGLELIKIKKVTPHGKWEEWVRNHCEFELRTAQRYMALASNVKEKALKTTPVSFLELLEEKPSNLAPAQRDRLLKSVQKLTDGNTVQQLYIDYGISKKQGGSKGGDLKSKAPALVETSSDALTLPVAPQPPEEDSLERAAIDIYKPIMADLIRHGLEDKTWANLPDVEQEQFFGLLTDIIRVRKEGQAKAKTA